MAISPVTNSPIVLPDDAIRAIAMYIADPTTTIAASRVCKNWQTALADERVSAIEQILFLKMSVEISYPPELLGIFRDAGRPIHRLPVVDEGNLERDFIGNINLTSVDMGGVSIRRITSGRRGIALLLRARRDGTETKVVAIPERYGASWGFPLLVYSRGHTDEIEGGLCPLNFYTILRSVLEDRHPVLRLADANP
jgi:hypothetical protein